jgi:hypothetical protein
MRVLLCLAGVVVGGVFIAAGMATVAPLLILIGFILLPASIILGL